MITHEAIPIIMSDFMAKMTKQCTIWLIHGAALLLALCIVGFGQIDRDYAL
jgi:hypothetical protein